MANRRLEFHQMLLNETGLSRAYFAPPISIKMEYPCIMYKRIGINQVNADGALYSMTERYEVTIVTADPDSAYLHSLVGKRYCRFDREYVANGLVHAVYVINF